MRQLAIWHKDELGMSTAEFTRLCEDFRTAALKEALGTLASAQQDDQTNPGKALSRIAQLDLNPLIVAANFVKTASKVAASPYLNLISQDLARPVRRRAGAD